MLTIQLDATRNLKGKGPIRDRLIFEEVYLMPEELKTTIQGLQCREEYLPTPVETEVLIDILDHFKFTPSTANMQPWEVIIVTNPDMRASLIDALLDPMLREDDELRQEWLAEVPLILVICMDSRRAKVRFGERGTEFALMDIGAAVMSLLIGAWNQGLKSCCLREIDQDKVRTLLDAPKNVIPVMLVALGYSDQEKAPAPTLDLKDFVHKETWNGEW